MNPEQALLSTLDYAIFFGSLILVMIIGLWAGRKEDTAEDFYLAGKGARWWGVAGSIFGSNVSANHIVGMMGVGFSLGFVESHFEITAIAGLLLLCYFFLPVYRKLNIYTLSDYLSRRYDDRSRVAYALIMIHHHRGRHDGPGVLYRVQGPEHSTGRPGAGAAGTGERCSRTAHWHSD